MNYCIVKNGIIENVIVCDSAEVAAQFGALPGYDGAAIGTPYAPPPAPPEPDPAPTQLDRVEAQATYTAMMTDTLLEEV